VLIQRPQFHQPALSIERNTNSSIFQKIQLSQSANLWHASAIVNLTEFKEQAAALTVEQRASLASFLLHSLPEPAYDVSDEEVAERLLQMKSGDEAGHDVAQ
jgi:hypothetical protein